MPEWKNTYDDNDDDDFDIDDYDADDDDDDLVMIMLTYLEKEEGSTDYSGSLILSRLQPATRYSYISEYNLVVEKNLFHISELALKLRFCISFHCRIELVLTLTLRFEIGESGESYFQLTFAFHHFLLQIKIIYHHQDNEIPNLSLPSISPGMSS